MTEPEPWHPKLTVWVDAVDAAWQRLGVSAPTRRLLRIDLVTDLAQAHLRGTALEELLDTDPVRFAGDVAVAHGIATPPSAAAEVESARAVESGLRHPGCSGMSAVGRLVGAGLGGAFLGGLGSLEVLFHFETWLDSHIGYAGDGGVALTIYVIAALIAALCGGLAVAVAFGDCQDPRRLGRSAALGLLTSGALATLVTVGVARSTGYSTRSSVIAIELGLVAAICSIGLVAVAIRHLSGRGKGQSWKTSIG